MFSPIIRSTWLYLQHLVEFTQVAAGWCFGWVHNKQDFFFFCSSSLHEWKIRSCHTTWQSLHTILFFYFNHIQNIHFLTNWKDIPASLRLRSITSITTLTPWTIITVNKGFLNTNTAITRQLIRTARTLEAKWWQVCGEAWVRGQRKMSQLLGALGLLDFTMLRPVLSWRAFWNL